MNPRQLIFYGIVAIVAIFVLMWFVLPLLGFGLGLTVGGLLFGTWDVLLAITLVAVGFFLLIGWPFALPGNLRWIVGFGAVLIALLIFMGVL